MPDQFDAYVSGVPTDAATQRALAAELRRQATMGSMAQLTGDRVAAPWGAQQQQEAMHGGQTIAGEREKQSALAQTLALHQQSMEHEGATLAESVREHNLSHQDRVAQNAALNDIRNQGLDIRRQQLLDKEQQTQAGEGPNKGDAAKARQSLDTVQQLRDLAKQVEANPGAIKPTADAAMSVLPTWTRGTGENLAYNEDQQKIRTNGQLLYQVMRKQLDGLRPNAQLIAQAAQWEPFQAGDDAKRTIIKLNNAADHLEGQAKAVLNTPSKNLTEGQSVDWDLGTAGTKEAGKPISAADRARAAVRTAAPQAPAMAAPAGPMLPQAMQGQQPRPPTPYIPNMLQGGAFNVGPPSN